MTDYYKITQKEREIDNLHIEKLTTQYLTENSKNWKLKKIQTIKKASQQKVHIYQIEIQDRFAIFDADLALENEHFEFLAVGHPIVNEALEHFIQHPHKNMMMKLRFSAIRKNGIYFVFILTYKIKANIHKKELLCVYTSSFDSNEFEIL
ncbi:MAG: hypothetical protein ABDH59_02530, partial [Fervidobacterium sp.]